MSYEKQEWSDLPLQTTPINATRLNHIENGIDSVEKEIPTISTTEPTSDIWFKHSDNLFNAPSTSYASTTGIITTISNGSLINLSGTSNGTGGHLLYPSSKYLGVFDAGNYKLKLFNIQGTGTNTNNTAVIIVDSSNNVIVNTRVGILLANAESITLTETKTLYIQLYQVDQVSSYSDYYLGAVLQKGVDDITEYIPHIDNSIQLKNSAGQYMPFMGEMGTIERSFYDSATNSYVVMYTTGFMICCHTVQYVGAVNTPWGSLYVSNQIEVPKFPVKFNIIYSTSYGTTGHQSIFVLNGGLWSEDRPSPIFIATGTAVDGSYIFATITTFGTWK